MYLSEAVLAHMHEALNSNPNTEKGRGVKHLFVLSANEESIGQNKL